MPPSTPSQNGLLNEIRDLILAARQRAASAVNAELTLLYWQVGRRLSTEVLKGGRAGYGSRVIATLAEHLSLEVGQNWSENLLRHCLRLAETFPDEQILSALRRELMRLGESNIRVADYLTVLPAREMLQAKLHQSIEIARRSLEARVGAGQPGFRFSGETTGNPWTKAKALSPKRSAGACTNGMSGLAKDARPGREVPNGFGGPRWDRA